MMRVDIDFTDIECKCGGYAGFAERCKHQDKYKLYCAKCGKYLGFATTERKVIIKARENWQREHSKV